MRLGQGHAGSSRAGVVMRFWARAGELKLRSIGIRDYAVLESEQRIGRIRLASERIELHPVLLTPA